MSSSDPAPTTRDKACAVLARAALFPISVDWSGKHRTIRPAVQALDQLRQDILQAENLPFSKLFPRHVMVVPSPDGSMQWNGMPDIVEATVEVIPNRLQVTSTDCSQMADLLQTTKSFVRSTEVMKEIVLCSNVLLQKDYDRCNDPTLLEQRKDLPPQSLTVVEETLAHEMIKLHNNEKKKNDKDSDNDRCVTLAKLEVQAARLSECLFAKEGSEVYRGGSLRPVGFSWLPSSLQTNLRDRCIQAVAIGETAKEFGNTEAKRCVHEVMNKA